MPLIVVFPASTDSRTLPDAKFLKEAIACEDLGIDFTTVDLCAIKAGNLAAAFAHTASGNQRLGIYRGVTLRPDEYAFLYEGLKERGIRLLTSPEQFANTQLLPNFFPKIADLSLPAITTTEMDPQRIQLAATALGPPPYFIKDYVKSAKEIWPRGCVVPAPGRPEDFAQTIAELLDFRGDRFETGLVIRPLIELRSLGLDPFGDEDLEEYRMVFLRGRRVFTFPYGYHAGSYTDFSRYDVIGERIDSPFFMADCVVTVAGECFVLETGDGGCCGLPPQLSAREFYARLKLELFE